MSHKFAVSAAFLGLAAVATGGRAQDFASDGSVIALPWNSMAQTVNLQTGVLTTVPKGEEATRIRWSPNGRYLLFVTGRGETSLRLFDTKVGATRVLGANLNFPVAWREDSNRIALFHSPPTGKGEFIEYGVSEKGIALRTNIAVMPVADSPMVWLPTTDNVAYVGKDGNVYTVEEGEIKKITNSNDVIGMELSGDQKSLVWARRGPNPKYILVTFYSYDLTSRSVKRLDFPGNIPGLNPNPRQAPVSIESAVLSPNGIWVALTVTEEQAGPKPPAAPKPVRRTGKKSKTKTTTIARPPAEAPKITKKVVYAVKMDGSGASAAATGTAGAALVPFWSRDSLTLAILVKDRSGNSVVTRQVESGANRVLLSSGR